MGSFDEIAVYDLCGGDGGLDCFVEFGTFFGGKGKFFDEVDYVFDTGFAEAEFLFLETTVCYAADEIVEAFAFDDPGEGYFGAFFVVEGEEGGGVDFGDPEEVAEGEGAEEGRGAFFGEFGGDVVAVVF